MLLCCDEIQTGLARTGRLLCCDHWGVRPDLVVGFDQIEICVGNACQGSGEGIERGHVPRICRLIE